MVWTDVKPDSPGWYWMRNRFGLVTVREIRRYQSGLLWMMDDGACDIPDDGHQFAGPIPEPLDPP